MLNSRHCGVLMTNSTGNFNVKETPRGLKRRPGDCVVAPTHNLPQFSDAGRYCLHCNTYLGELIFERKSRFPKDYKEFKKLIESVFPYGTIYHNFYVITVLKRQV